MNGSDIHNLKKSSAKWLFVAALLLSFFTFWGFISQSQIIPDKPKTTLITASNLQLTKSISYKRALKPAQPKYLSLFCIVNANRLYTQQVKVRIAELGIIDSLPQTSLFYRARTISQNTGDEPAILIG